MSDAPITDEQNRMRRELAGFCREIGEDNPVSAMVELQAMKRELAEAKKDVERMDWILNADAESLTTLDQWDRDNIDDQIDKEELK